MTQTPTTGRTVHYLLSESDCEEINRRRVDSWEHRKNNTSDKPGWQAHMGNRVNLGDVVPLTIVQVWPGDLVNGQATLDGNDSLWVTSAKQGHSFGQWNWPPRESEQGR